MPSVALTEISRKLHQLKNDDDFEAAAALLNLILRKIPAAKDEFHKELDGTDPPDNKAIEQKKETLARWIEKLEVYEKEGTPLDLSIFSTKEAEKSKREWKQKISVVALTAMFGVIGGFLGTLLSFYWQNRGIAYTFEFQVEASHQSLWDSLQTSNSFFIDTKTIPLDTGGLASFCQPGGFAKEVEYSFSLPLGNYFAVSTAKILPGKNTLRVVRINEKKQSGANDSSANVGSVSSFTTSISLTNSNGGPIQLGDSHQVIITGLEGKGVISERKTSQNFILTIDSKNFEKTALVKVFEGKSLLGMDYVVLQEDAAVTLD